MCHPGRMREVHLGCVFPMECVKFLSDVWFQRNMRISLQTCHSERSAKHGVEEPAFCLYRRHCWGTQDVRAYGTDL